MILTYKIKHEQNYTVELSKAMQIANIALKTQTRTTKDVKHIGLKSVIANQILKKYSSNKVLKRVNSVKLSIPSQGIKTDSNFLIISSLKLQLPFEKTFKKVNQIELDKTYAYVSVTVDESKTIMPTQFLGVDLNTTGHCAVVANETTGKVLMLGKKAHHIHMKYKNIRKDLQRKAKFNHLKKIKNREQRIVKDLNHKISRRIVNEAIKQNAGIVIENLEGIRKSRKQAKIFKYALNSWSYYQLGMFIDYKAKLHGIPVFKIDPHYTSQQCSRCGLLGNRNKKEFKCSCEHVSHADVNAAFTIAERHTGRVRLPVEKDIGNRSTDTLKKATTRKLLTLEPNRL